ncbi:MAG: tyrosine-type recombinase/integrase [Gammaproteobacteria bacterium]
MHLTKRAIEGLKTPLKGYSIHRDDKEQGLAIRITAAGARTFIFEKRIHGRNRRISIGPFPTLSVEAATLRAKVLGGEIASGKDPVIERQRRAAENVTLREALEVYLAERPLKPGTRRDIEKAMQGLADWKRRPVRKITPAMIEHRHQALGEKSHAQANLTMRYLRAILNFAAVKYADDEGHPLLAYNPVKRLSANKAWYRVERRRTLLKEHEIKPWWDAVEALGADPLMRHGPEYRDYLITLLLTGLRRSEALNLTWDRVDFKARTLTIKDTKNREPHTLPLPKYLLGLFSERYERSAGKNVFSGSDEKRIDNLRFALARVVEQSGVSFSPHDLRRTFATIAERLDIPAYALKRLLNHKQSADVTAGYVVIDVERLRAPMEKITDFVLKAAGVKEAAAVLPHRAAGH